MKKELKDLKVSEFTRLCCGVEEVYNFSLYVSMEKKVVFRGTYSQMLNFLMSRPFGLPKKVATKYVDNFKQNAFDYNLTLSMLDIYEYLEFKTKGFQKDRCSIILDDMMVCHDIEIPEDRDIVIKRSIDNGDIQAERKEVYDPSLKKTITTLDYEAMYNKVYGVAYDLFYYKAIGILKEKMGIESDTKADADRPKELPEELSTPEAKEWLDYCVEKGLLDKDYQPTGKVYTEALKAYLAEKLNEKIFPNQKIHKWKPFETLWGCKDFTKKRYTSREQVGIVRDGEYIDKCFPNKIIEKGKHKK